MTTTAQAIRDLRGLRTQQRFADDLGVSRGTVIAWERGSHVSLANARLLVAHGIAPELFIAPATAALAHEVA